MMLSTSATITRAPTGLATCSGRDHRTAGIPYRGGREGNPCLPGAVHARRRRPLAAAARGSGHPYRSQTPTRPNPSDRRRQVPCRPRQRGSDPEAPLSIGPRRVNCPPIAPDCRRSLKRTQQYSKLWTPQVRRVEYGVESRGSRMPASTREPSVPAGDDHTRAGKAGALCGALLWFDPGGGLLPSRPQDILG